MNKDLLKKITAYTLSFVASFNMSLLDWTPSVKKNSNRTGYLPVVKDAFAEVVNQVKPVLNKVFSEADHYEKEQHFLDQNQLFAIGEESETQVDLNIDQNYTFILAKSGEKTIGYAAEHTVFGKWGPIRYLLCITPEGKILDVSVIEYRERRGRPISKRRFTRQFEGKNLSDDIRWQKDIRGVTGASISSRGITDGIRKTLHVFKHLYTSK